MYRTCLFCSRDLGSNEALELLPVGRRIAFDVAKGRLWVVCRGCERWNLVPFDSRLEAIENCERLFQSTRTRFSTANIGIARLPEGLELVRIGPAERPEFAAWRYGDQFGRRRNRAIMIGAAGAAAVVGVYYLGSVVGVSAGIMPSLINSGSAFLRSRWVAARIPVRNGIGGAVTHADLKKVSLITNLDREWGLSVPLVTDTNERFLNVRETKSLTRHLWGEDALAAMRHLLPSINQSGGSATLVQSAVTLVGQRSLPDLLSESRVGWKGKKKGRVNPAPLQPLHKVSPTVRLALEMATHEENEREALAGDLKFLERQWREAEKLAAIADSLALPESVDDEMQRLRDRNE